MQELAISGIKGDVYGYLTQLSQILLIYTFMKGSDPVEENLTNQCSHKYENFML